MLLSVEVQHRRCFVGFFLLLHFLPLKVSVSC